VLEARLDWLNSKGTTEYILPSPYGMRKGPERDAIKKSHEEAIDKILTSPRYRSLVRAAVSGLPLSPSSFVKDDDLDNNVFCEPIEDLDSLFSEVAST
jgi:hypothetical protein